MGDDVWIESVESESGPSAEKEGIEHQEDVSSFLPVEGAKRPSILYHLEGMGGQARSTVVC